jgi:hypothetical protein
MTIDSIQYIGKNQKVSAHVDPYHRRTFYAVHGNEFTLLKSTDGGQNWVAVGWLPGHDC